VATIARTTRISTNFVVGEFWSRDGAPVPSASMPALIGLVTRYLQPARRKYGRCTVHSGHRSPEHNRRVGGVPLSQHVYTMTPSSVAADVSFERGDVDDWWRFFHALGAGGLGRYPSYVHVDNRAQLARW